MKTSSFLVSFTFLLLALTINGQETTVKKISVVDSQGAAVSDASVSVVWAASSRTRSYTSDREGIVLVTLPSDSDVSIDVSANGFERKTVRLASGDSPELTVALEPKSVAAVVSVSENFLAGNPEALGRTPGSIQTISPAELELSRVFNFAEALRKVPGINVRNEEGFGLRPNISIRGSDPTRSRKVLILEDGIPLSYAPYGDNSSYYHPPIERFDSVEVLKGSGQIEYGPVTVAGVVNYLTPQPTEKDVFTLRLTGGNRDFFNGTAGYSGTFGETGIVTEFTRKQGQGSRENLRSGINDLSVKIVQPAGDRNIFVFRYSHFNEDSRLTYSGLTEEEYAEDPRQNPFRNDDLDFFREGFSASHTGVIGSRSSITTNFYTSYFSRDWWRQSSNSDQRPNRLGSDPDCGGMEDLNTTCGNQGTPRDFRVIGVEPKFSSSLEAGKVRTEITGGFRLHYETQYRRAYLGDLPDSRDGVPTELNRRNSLAASGFVQSRFIFNRLSVTPGLRIERVNYERTNLLNGASATTGITQLIPGIGAAFNINSNTTLFGGVHRGFAPPSTADILTNSGGVVDLDAELSWSYEAGVRSRPFDGFTLEAVYFRNDYENQIVPSSVAGGSGSTRVNAGETLHSGFEFSGRFDSNRVFLTRFNLFLQTAYTFLGEASYRGARYSSIPGFENVIITGNRLPYAPKHLATSSVGIEYGGFKGFVENVYIGSQFSDDLNSFESIPNGQRGFIPRQTYFNSTVNYEVESLSSSFFVTVKNLFDELYIVDRTRGIYPSSPRLLQFGWVWRFAR